MRRYNRVLKPKYVPLEKRRALRSAAMPEIKRLVKKYGRTIVASCLVNLKEHDQKLARIAALKREAAELEKAI